jgi:uncharacterized membrane protein YphA (DoxX/SURF4 family)
MDNITIGQSSSKRNIFFRIVSFSWIKKSLLVEIIALLFVILFLYTGISKWIDYYLFIESVGTTPLLEPVAGLIAISLPATEIIVSVLLFIPRTRLIGLYASLVLMVLFIIYIIYILNIDDKLPCSCGGILQQLSWKQHLVVNGVFVLLALTAILLTQKDTVNISHKKF